MKWGGAVVSVLLVVVWIASNWLLITCLGRWPQSWDLSVMTGVVELEWGSFPIPGRAGFHIEYNESSVSSGFNWSVGRRGGMVQSPLWVLVAASALGTAAVFGIDTLAHRRARAGFCPECDYNLTGLAPGAVCPECGTAALASKG